MTTWLLSNMGRVFFSSKNRYSKDNILCVSNSKAPCKVKRYLLTSYNVNDVTERAPRDDYGNITLMAQGAKQEFIFHFASQLMLQSRFPVNNDFNTQ